MKFRWKLYSKLSSSKEAGKSLCAKFVRVMLKNCPTKNWLEKVIRKSYKYHKSCAKKLSSNSYAEKLSSNSCLKKLYIHILEVTF